jgi:hypothetical protein
MKLSTQNYNGHWRFGEDNLNNWPYQPASHYFQGQIDEVAIFDTALSSNNVAAIYGAKSAGMCPPPLRWWLRHEQDGAKRLRVAAVIQSEAQEEDKSCLEGGFGSCLWSETVLCQSSLLTQGQHLLSCCELRFLIQQVGNIDPGAHRQPLGNPSQIMVVSCRSRRAIITSRARQKDARTACAWSVLGRASAPASEHLTLCEFARNSLRCNCLRELTPRSRQNILQISFVNPMRILERASKPSA